MSKKNTSLHKAKKEKNDEFYTLLSDIEKEMVWYKDFFKDKVVYCNCDDARESNFFKYFSENFELLGLKRLITTGYKKGENGVVLIYDGDKNGDFKVSDDEIITQTLAGDGDFRSPECIEYLKQADVVVTNPPFSLWREYIGQLFQYKKKFIIMGNGNAVCCKEIFPKIQNGELWLGRTLFTGKMPYFKVKEGFTVENERYETRDDGIYKQVNSIAWFTNVSNNNSREILSIVKKYSATDHPKYDNYDAIEVGRIQDFPCEYYGVAGVPITALKYLWSDGTLHLEEDGKDVQFDIIGLGASHGKTPKHIPNESGCIGGKWCYARIFIKRKIS